MLLPLVFAQAVTMQDAPTAPLPPARENVAPTAPVDTGSNGVGLDRPVHTSSYVLRMSAGFGPVMPSEQEDLLGEEHYGGGRWLGILDGAGRLGGRFLVGGFLAGALREAYPSERGGPRLDEHAVFTGAEGMLLAGDGTCRFPLVARLGYARGAEGLHGQPRWEGAPVFGAEAAFMCLHIGAAAGFLAAPAAPPGDLGGSWNMGSFYVSFLGAIYN